MRRCRPFAFLLAFVIAGAQITGISSKKQLLCRSTFPGTFLTPLRYKHLHMWEAHGFRAIAPRILRPALALFIHEVTAIRGSASKHACRPWCGKQAGASARSPPPPPPPRVGELLVLCGAALKGPPRRPPLSGAKWRAPSPSGTRERPRQ